MLGEKKSLRARRNDRSSDWIAPSTANGCAMACSYCYVPRRKGYANPITVFTNIDRITGYLERHAARQGVKTEGNQCDPVDWVYDIGENSDCSVDAAISDNLRDLVTLFGRIPNAKASFASNLVNRDLLDYEPRSGTRIRFSLMPAGISKAEKLFHLAIAAARERLHITSAYLAPPAALIDALVAAAQRGVDEQVLVNGPEGEQGQDVRSCDGSNRRHES